MYDTLPTKQCPKAAAKPGLMQEVGEAQNHVRYARAAVALSLICTAVACGYGSYRMLSDLEAELGYSQYDYVASSFGPILDDSVAEKISSMQILGYHIQASCAYGNRWPNCSLPKSTFEYLTEKQLSIAGLEAAVFGPLLTSEQVDPFEKFAYDFYESEGEPSLGISDFGKGIFAFDPSGSGERIHDFDSSNAKGERDILVPVFQHASLTPNPSVVMYNLYSEPTRAASIDRAIDCAAAGDGCFSISPPLNLLRDEVRPASLMVIPMRSGETVTGVAVAVFFWDQIIKGAVPSSADQIHVVVANSETDKSFTYVFEHGELKYIGEGDRSSGDFPDLERTYSIDQFGEGVYSITISPTTAFMDDYQTYAPIVVCVVAVFIILLTSLVFIAYDYFVKTQSQMHDNIMESKRMFVRYISHEIRTPLNTVHLGMKVLYEELCDVLKLLKQGSPKIGAKIDSLIEFVMDIDESNDSAVGVLNDLINYDKILVGSLSLESGQHDAIKLVTDTVRPFNVQAYKRKINFIIDADLKGNCSGGLSNDVPSLFIVGDDMKLKQVLRNVVSNALKFTNEGGTITITVQWISEEYRECSDKKESRPAGSIRIAVTDTGVGLSKESLAVVGGEYVQINARDLQSGGGSGLGLWISKNIVRLHRGSMSVDSAGLGCGTTVTIILPVLTVGLDGLASLSMPSTLRSHNATRDPYVDLSTFPSCDLVRSYKIHPSESVDTLGGTPSVQSLQCDIDSKSVSRIPIAPASLSGPSKTVKNILVVDDVSSTRRIVVRMLNRAGFDCLEAASGEECLEVVTQHGNIDLVLMDYEMPVMNGPDATRAIYKKWGSKLPVVGLTGNALQQDVDFFKNHGAVEVLVKPLNLKHLSDVLESLNAPVR